MKEKKSFKEKTEEHKNEILIGVGVITVVTIAIIGIKNKDKIKKNFINLTENNDKKTEKIAESLVINKNDNKLLKEKKINVTGHVRNLPSNHTASQQKKNFAKKHGIKINEHQTYVETYEKNIAA